MSRTLFVICFIITGLFLSGHATEAKVYLPNGATDAAGHAQWFLGGSTCAAPSGAGVFTEIDEYASLDNDTSYNCVNAANQLQFYHLENSADSGTITKVTVRASARGVTAGESLQLGIRIGGIDYFGATETLGTSYAAYAASWLIHPLTGLAWTTSDITALHIGVQSIMSGGTWDSEQRLTQVYLDVTFKTETNKTKYHILQNTGGFAPADPQIDTAFTVGIADPLDDIKTAFIEMKGVANTGSATLRVSLDDGNPMPACNTSRAKCYAINSAGRPVSFKILYDVTDYFKSTMRTSGTPSFTLNLKNDGPQALNIASGKLTVTYTWIVPPAITGAYAISGTLMSSTFDTGAVNGAGFHSLGYVGVLNGGRVRFQVATSNCSNGATNAPTCTTGAWGSTGSDFYGEAGGSCTNTNWYEPTVNTAFPLTNVIPITSCRAQLNNKRYFRYLTQLCSLNCAGSSAFTPEVRDIIINWSP